MGRVRFCKWTKIVFYLERSHQSSENVADKENFKYEEEGLIHTLYYQIKSLTVSCKWIIALPSLRILFSFSGVDIFAKKYQEAQKTYPYKNFFLDDHQGVSHVVFGW